MERCYSLPLTGGGQLTYRLLTLVQSAAALFSAGGDNSSSAAASRAQINARAEKMLDQHGNSILRCAYAYLHNKEDAEEILQETLIRFLRAAPRLESPDHERAWLLHVAANLCKNRIRYDTLHRTDQLSEDLAAAQRSDLSFVWEAVKALPESCRAAVHLYYHEGLSTAEIAKILNRRESTVRSDLRRGRNRLKTILKEEYDFDETV